MTWVANRGHYFISGQSTVGGWGGLARHGEDFDDKAAESRHISRLRRLRILLTLIWEVVRKEAECFSSLSCVLLKWEAGVRSTHRCHPDGVPECAAAATSSHAVEWREALNSATGSPLAVHSPTFPCCYVCAFSRNQSLRHPITVLPPYEVTCPRTFLEISPFQDIYTFFLLCTV
jgi:hypothetical protein